MSLCETVNPRARAQFRRETLINFDLSIPFNIHNNISLSVSFLHPPPAPRVRFIPFPPPLLLLLPSFSFFFSIFLSLRFFSPCTRACTRYTVYHFFFRPLNSFFFLSFTLFNYYAKKKKKRTVKPPTTYLSSICPFSNLFSFVFISFFFHRFHSLSPAVRAFA